MVEEGTLAGKRRITMHQILPVATRSFASNGAIRHLALRLILSLMGLVIALKIAG
jgi:hypothetical protein